MNRKKKGLKAVNRRAKRLEERDVFAMGDIDVLWDQPVGCTGAWCRHAGRCAGRVA